MSVWSDTAPTSPSLLGPEGELISVSIAVEAHQLEALLDALAHVPFPINPQIYHHATVARICPGGRREVLPATVVEFPAYAGRLDEAREVLAAFGFDSTALEVRGMLDALHQTVLPYRQAGAVW